MLHGEFTAITTIDRLSPGLVPKPLGWGKFQQQRTETPETYFLLEDFLTLHPDPPNPAKLFGFAVPTYDGKVAHTTAWEPSWSAFFTRLLRRTLATDEEANGPWPALRAAADRILAALAPRLLEPLAIIPCLIHGDLWAGNTGTDAATGDVVFYDAASYYAHSEMELGMWRRGAPAYLGRRYMREYLDLVGPAEPRDEFEDRNRLYCLQYLLSYSVGHPGPVERRTALNDMLFLCEKYAPFGHAPEI
ncbi:Uu.00g066770.m01.CDS01 [Anthostomella pinea]|uniref:protein-ribulosamine 3-kinase n=1 Tax=Anthostomella pinea TaxID=933095 RepID=A0AAI8VU04_9PEZI|nr:Uu.00g066770.m01.CDS01 [Anthostomella pinea]